MKKFRDFATEMINRIEESSGDLKVGSEVSFNHHQHGKITGTYKGMRRMGGRSYAAIDHPVHGMTYTPPRDIVK